MKSQNESSNTAIEWMPTVCWPDAAISPFRVFVFSPFTLQTRNQEIEKSRIQEIRRTGNRESENLKSRNQIPVFTFFYSHFRFSAFPIS